MSEISEKILKKVKDKEVKHKPKWYFIGKRILIWTALVMAILLCAMSISMIIFEFTSIDWDVLPRAFGAESRSFEGKLGLFFRVLPYFWAVIAAILFTFVYFNFKKTKTGYRHRGTLVVLISISISVVLGVGIDFVNAPDAWDPQFRQFPYYEMLLFDRQGAWMTPEEGLLGGEVINEIMDHKFGLKDFKGNEWKIIVKGAGVEGQYLIITNEMIKVIGEKVGDMEFEAEEIRPWNKMSQKMAIPLGRR